MYSIWPRRCRVPRVVPLLIAIWVVPVLSTSVLAQQTNGPIVQVAYAAISEVMAQDDYAGLLPNREIKVDLERLPASAQFEVSTRLSLEQASVEETFRCRVPNRLSTCHLRAADFLIVLKEIDVGEDEAQVLVEVQGETDSTRQPVWQNGWRVFLVRDRGRWSVKETVVEYQS